MIIAMVKTADSIPVEVMTVSGRGWSAEECANMARKEIIHVSENSPEFIRAQATAYADKIERVIGHYMRQAIRSDRTTIYNALMDAGHPELAKLIQGL